MAFVDAGDDHDKAPNQEAPKQLVRELVKAPVVREAASKKAYEKQPAPKQNYRWHI
jgi:hypothetical protein